MGDFERCGKKEIHSVRRTKGEEKTHNQVFYFVLRAMLGEGKQKVSCGGVG